MKIYPLNRENLPIYEQRFQGLQPDSERFFGTMDTIQMLRHMRNFVEVSLGLVVVDDNSKLVWRHILYFLSVHVVTTWPGGRLKQPDFWTPPPEHDFDEERRLLIARLLQFVEKLESEPSTVAVCLDLGPMAMKRWSRVHGVHFNHHFRQFGV